MEKNMLSGINLNLLHVLHTLFEKRSIKETAIHLDISQSAVSYSLKKLREIFDDDLLITVNKQKIEMTQLANSISEPLAEVISDMEYIINFKDFTPSSSKRKFKIAMTEYSVLLLLVKLYKYIKQNAPGVIVETVPFNFDNVLEQLELNEFDIAIGDFGNPLQNDKIICKDLFQDNFSCIVSENHPLLSTEDALSYDNFMNYPTLLITRPKRNETIELAHKRSILNNNSPIKGDLYMHNTSAAINVLEESVMTLLLPHKAAQKLEKTYKVKIIKPDFLDIDFSISICRSKVSENDKGIEWLLNMFHEISEEYI